LPRKSKQESRQIFASKYKTVLPTEKEWAELITRENRKLLGESKKSVAKVTQKVYDQA